MSIVDQLKYQFKTGGTYMKIIYINVGVYLFFLLIGTLSTLMKWDFNPVIIENYLTFNSSPIYLIKRPWTILTYMFLHGSFWHIFNNMLIYFFTARMFEDLLGKRAALNTYLIGGFCGAIMYLITQNLFPFFRDMGDIPMLGASAAVMAVFVGLATYSPNYEVMLFGVIRVKMKYLAMIWVGFDVIGLANTDGVAHFAHLGGAIWGYLYIIYLRKGKDISSWLNQIQDILSSLFKKKKIKIVYKKSKPVTKKRKEDTKSRQEKVDAILDKIKASGYDSLSKEEKDYLFDASKNI